MRWKALRDLAQIVLGMTVGLGIGMVLGSGRCAGPLTAAETSSLHSGPTVEQVHSLSSLVTTRVDVSDVQLTQIEGYLGGVSAVLLVKGDFLLGTDLAKARFTSLDSKRRQAVLLLEQPQMTSPRVDQEKTRIFAIASHGLWQIVPSNQSDLAVTARAYADAQKLIAQAGEDPAHAERARGQAAQVLKTFFDAMGWKVEVRWI